MGFTRLLFSPLFIVLPDGEEWASMLRAEFTPRAPAHGARTTSPAKMPEGFEFYQLTDARIITRGDIRRCLNVKDAPRSGFRSFSLPEGPAALIKALSEDPLSSALEAHRIC